MQKANDPTKFLDRFAFRAAMNDEFAPTMVNAGRSETELEVGAVRQRASSQRLWCKSCDPSSARPFQCDTGAGDGRWWRVKGCLLVVENGEGEGEGGGSGGESRMG